VDNLFKGNHYYYTYKNKIIFFVGG